VGARPVEAARVRGWVVGACVVLLAGCSAASSGSAASPAAPAQRGAAASTTGTAPRVGVRTAPWRLASAVARPVAVGTPRGLLVAGGLAASGGSTSAALTYDGTGRVVGRARLAVAVRDAGGAELAGRAMVMGGGDSTVGGAVQVVPSRGPGAVVGRLPAPRADLTVASVTGPSTGTAYVVGGYDGSVPDRRVLATSDGTRFTTVAWLPVGVRYPAAAASGGSLWVFGGEVGSTIRTGSTCWARTRRSAGSRRPADGRGLTVVPGCAWGGRVSPSGSGRSRCRRRSSRRSR
jgi:hypothetical protein